MAYFKEIERDNGTIRIEVEITTPNKGTCFSVRIHIKPIDGEWRCATDEFKLTPEYQKEEELKQELMMNNFHNQFITQDELYAAKEEALQNKNK